MPSELETTLQQIAHNSQQLPADLSDSEALHTHLLEICSQISTALLALHQQPDHPASEEAGVLHRLVQALEHAEADRKRQSRHLAALNKASTALLSTLDLDTLLGQILDAARGAIPRADEANIYLFARDTGQLELRASTGQRDPRIHHVSVGGGSDYINLAVQEDRPLLLNTLPTSPQSQANPAAQAAIIAPLVHQNRVLGALALTAHQQEVFNSSDLELLVSFAATAVQAINNAELHREVRKLAMTDSLTGLYNRRGFVELGEREVARALRFNRPLSAMMLDIDHFKIVNDRYGHPAGDQILRFVATQCNRNLRKIDLMSRYGGDEFAILLPETKQSAARQVAERIRTELTWNRLPVNGEMIGISLSLGIANGNHAIGSLDALLKRADLALMQAKQTGRNRVCAL